jgi:hypothetical protein
VPLVASFVTVTWMIIVLEWFQVRYFNPGAPSGDGQAEVAEA